MNKPVINGIALSTPEDVDEACQGQSAQFDDYIPAIVGITTGDRIVYSYEKIVLLLMERDGMSDEDAREFVDYNVVRTLPYMENAPVIVYEAEYEEG